MSRTLDILVLYYSEGGHTEALARQVARGVDSVSGTAARLRTVPAAGAAGGPESRGPERGPAWVVKQDLAECGGLVLGSPTRFGNMAAPLSQFLESTGTEWFSGTLAGKPAGVFTTTASLHGGQESTLLSMMLPLLHHGMLIVGLPYTESGIVRTRGGGSPYGAGHHAGWNGERELDADEIALARALGSRVARMALRLAA